mgnify:CR=1 FL=1
MLPSEESEDFAWTAWDGLPEARALDGQPASEHSLNIRWGRLSKRRPWPRKLSFFIQLQRSSSSILSREGTPAGGPGAGRAAGQ